MKIIIVMDSFKERLTAIKASDEEKDGLSTILGRSACYLECPVADGGEGTAAAMMQWPSSLDEVLSEAEENLFRTSQTIEHLILLFMNQQKRSQASS